MKQIDVNELKLIQLNILDHFVNFCNDNKIHYWLVGGTLLGAIRHKGYIPWDDDIDIGMLRQDYDKLIRLYDNNCSKFKFLTVENDHSYCYPMGKMTDESTVLIQSGEKHGYYISVYIDIFTYDNAPNNPAVVQKIFSRRDLLNHIRTLQSSYVHRGSSLRRIMVSIICFLCRCIIPRRYLASQITSNAKKFQNIQTQKIGDFVGTYRVTMPKAWVQEQIQMDFEGRRLRVPKHYHEWLQLFYGDYMKLPPEEERVPHHNFYAYYK